VKAIFLRMSATWKALRIVESMGVAPRLRAPQHSLPRSARF
jgi:hypothetical protein